jgi:hypothetical protein
LLEAARRNNTDLLMEVLKTNSTAEFLNNSTDALGNTALHIAAKHGSCVFSPRGGVRCVGEAALLRGGWLIDNLVVIMTG